MKCIYATWCVMLLFFSVSCMIPTVLSIKTQAEEIIRTQQDLRRKCKEKIQDKEPRKAIKAQLNKIICLCNKAYAQAENEECARSFLKQAQEVTNQVMLNPLMKTTKAAL